MLARRYEVPLWVLVLVAAVSISLLLSGVGRMQRTRSDDNDIPVSPTFLAVLSVNPVNTQTPSPTPTSTATLIPPTSTPTPRPTLTPSPTPIAVITGIQAFGRLETAQYMVRDIVAMEDGPDTIFDRLSRDRLLLIAEGEVVAGFDLSKVKQGDIVAIHDTVLILLPEPEILYSRIDNDRTYVYERDTGLLRRPDPDLETEARRLAEHHVRDWALENGILEDATEFGFLYLEIFLRSLGFTRIRLEIRK